MTLKTLSIHLRTNLLALLAFIRTAHYWTVVHPGLDIENDVRDLMASHKELAALLLQDPDLG